MPKPRTAIGYAGCPRSMPADDKSLRLIAANPRKTKTERALAQIALAAIKYAKRRK